MKSHYNPISISLDKFESKGREIYGSKFRIFSEDIPLITKLLVFKAGDQALANEYQINLGKGILLIGPVGSGKTSMMNVLRNLDDKIPSFAIKTTREISYEFAQNGYETILKYAKNLSYFDKKPIVYCFDDLGVERSLKYFGNQANVMEEILLSRYEEFITEGILTHITTNLNSTELENMYGLRVRSRMREMFNLFSFPANTPDKRK